MRGHGLRGSGFLADQLHRSASERVTPALRFGFAVDGEGEHFGNPRTHFRSIPKKCHCGQAGAVEEGLIPDAGDAVRDRDARQAGAAPEGPFPDAGDAVRDRDTRQAAAGLEGVIPDAGEQTVFPESDAREAGAVYEGGSLYAGDAIRGRDARQATAASEGTRPNAGNAIRDRDAR